MSVLAAARLLRSVSRLSAHRCMYEAPKRCLLQQATMVHRALVLLAPGGEEIEVLTPVDVLRRANIEVTLASVLVCA